MEVQLHCMYSSVSAVYLCHLHSPMEVQLYCMYTLLSLLSTSAIFHSPMEMQLNSLYSSVTAGYLCHLPYPNGSAAVLNVLFCLCAIYLWHLPFPNGSAAVQHVIFCLCCLPLSSSIPQQKCSCTACTLTSFLTTSVISLSKMEFLLHSLYFYVSAS
jgi:hypothetical protein